MLHYVLKKTFLKAIYCSSLHYVSGFFWSRQHQSVFSGIPGSFTKEFHRPVYLAATEQLFFLLLSVILSFRHTPHNIVSLPWLILIELFLREYRHSDASGRLLPSASSFQQQVSPLSSLLFLFIFWFVFIHSSLLSLVCYAFFVVI